jgi:hypothetical protein
MVWGLRRPIGDNMTDFVHATPQSSTLIPQQITPVGANTSGSIPQVTTNFQPAPNTSLSGGRAAIAVILVFVFVGAMFYTKYQQQIDAFFSEGSQERPVVVKAKPPAKMSKLDQSEGRPTVEPPLPTIVRSNQPSQLYYGP